MISCPILPVRETQSPDVGLQILSAGHGVFLLAHLSSIDVLLGFAGLDDLCGCGGAGF